MRAEWFEESGLYPMLPARTDTSDICLQWSDGFPLLRRHQTRDASLARG